MFSILDYRSVVALQEERNFVRAAEGLGVSQPALTARLRRIEMALGVKLFERGRQGADPTPAGMAFTDAARRIVEMAELSVVSAREADQGLGQFLRIGMTQIAAVQLVVPILSAFRQTHPYARVRLIEGNTAALEAQVEQNHLDVAFLHPPVHQLGLSEHLLHAEPMVKYDPTASPEDRPPTIRYTRREAPVLVAEIDRQEPEGADLEPMAEVDTVMGAVVLAHAGYGPSVIPERFPSPFAEPVGREGPVRTSLGVDLGTSIVWRSLDRRPMVRALLDICREGQWQTDNPPG